MNRLRITNNSIVQRKNDLLFNEIDGETVLMSIRNSEYYGLNKVGSRIWQLLEDPIAVKSIISKLLDEYEISYNQCFDDTLDFLTILDEKKILSVN